MATTHTMEEVREDWNDVVLRPGMNVLAIHLTDMLAGQRAKLESEADSYDKVCAIRGGIEATRRVIHWVKAEYDRAAKGDKVQGDTPEKER